jgi:hypothetical protein
LVSVQFECQDCRAQVYLLDGDFVPRPTRCAVCDFLAQVPEEEQEQAAEVVWHRYPEELAAWRSRRT